MSGLTGIPYVKCASIDTMAPVLTISLPDRKIYLRTYEAKPSKNLVSIVISHFGGLGQIYLDKTAVKASLGIEPHKSPDITRLFKKRMVDLVEEYLTKKCKMHKIADHEFQCENKIIFVDEQGFTFVKGLVKREKT